MPLSILEYFFTRFLDLFITVEEKKWVQTGNLVSESSFVSFQIELLLQIKRHELTNSLLFFVLQKLLSSFGNRRFGQVNAREVKYGQLSLSLDLDVGLLALVVHRYLRRCLGF